MRLRVRNIRDVAERQLCCGCGVCAYLSPGEIEMVDTLEYGRRPLLHCDPLRDARSTDAFAACPGIGLEHTFDPRDPALIRELTAGWGPIREVWEGHASDPEIRFAGSSGGAASALALFGLERNGMQGVLHIAARSDRPYLNHTALSRNRVEILAATGSRYAPASPCDGLQMIADASGPCLFIGKPCDVAAVQAARRLRSALDAKIALTIAIFCAGTPTTQGTLALLRQMGVKDLTSVRGLRYRGQGWPGRAHVACQNGNGTHTAELTYEQAWGEILQGHRLWRCYICPDHTGEFADLAVGDPWHRPRSDWQPGLSLVVVRTERGRAFLQAAMSAGYVSATQVDPQNLPASQPGMLRSRGSLWGRLLTLRLLGIPTPRYRRVPLFRFWLSEFGWAARARSVLGTARRALRRGLWMRRPVEPYNPNAVQIASSASSARAKRPWVQFVQRGLQKIENGGWELWLRTSTRGTASVQAPDAHGYATIAYTGINSILRRLAPCPTDVLVDIGCGKGRVVCCAARYPLAGVYGLDISPSLCAIAQRNAKRMRGRRAPVAIVNSDAQTWDYRASTILFLFNPFGRDTLERVLARVMDSVRRHGHTIRLVYVNPESECSLRTAGWELLERWPPRPSIGLDYPVTFWRLRITDAAPVCRAQAGAVPADTDVHLRPAAGAVTRTTTTFRRTSTAASTLDRRSSV